MGLWPNKEGYDHNLFANMPSQVFYLKKRLPLVGEWRGVSLKGFDVCALAMMGVRFVLAAISGINIPMMENLVLAKEELVTSWYMLYVMEISWNNEGSNSVNVKLGVSVHSGNVYHTGYHVRKAGHGLVLYNDESLVVGMIKIGLECPNFGYVFADYWMSMAKGSFEIAYAGLVQFLLNLENIQGAFWSFIVFNRRIDQSFQVVGFLFSTLSNVMLLKHFVCIVPCMVGSSYGCYSFEPSYHRNVRICESRMLGYCCVSFYSEQVVVSQLGASFRCDSFRNVVVEPRVGCTMFDLLKRKIARKVEVIKIFTIRWEVELVGLIMASRTTYVDYIKVTQGPAGGTFMMVVIG